MIMFIGDLAFIFLLSLPPFIAYLQSRRIEEFEKFTLWIFLVNFSLVKMMFDFGDSFWLVFFFAVPYHLSCLYSILCLFYKG